MFEFTLDSNKVRGSSANPRTQISWSLRDNDGNTLVIERYDERATEKSNRNFWLYYKGIVAGDIGSGSKTFSIVVNT